MNNETIKQMGTDYIMSTYLRHDLALVRGKGSYVWDAQGNKYLDLVSGIAVNNLGHCYPQVVKAIQKQAELLIHCSNLYWNEPQVRLAKKLSDCSQGKKVFFCNSGAEANEAAIKLARKWSRGNYGPERYEIITAEDSFHGRTLGALTATGQTVYQRWFQPLPKGFKYVPFNDLEALEQAITPQTCALLLEPIQGEGGVYPASKAYLTGVQKICAQHDLLLILDEVQTGCGRTGKLFAYQHYGVQPDLFTLAKGLGGGMPIGALIASAKVADVFKPGDHASTFGGNPLVTSAALAVLTVLTSGDFLKEVQAKGEYLKSKFKEMPAVKEVRGLGLLLGLELSVDGQKIQESCLQKGVLVNCIKRNVLRLVPALNIEQADLDKAVEIMGKVLHD